MANGILKRCTDCKKINNCCCNFDMIDFPILNKIEKEKINKLNINSERYITSINDACYNIKIENGICPFYKGKCSIYENRPLDCKLFPFDIKKIKQKYFLVLYKLDCFDYHHLLNENVDDVVEQIKPFIETFTDKKFNTKTDKLDYEIIKEI